VWARKFTVAHDCGLIINPDGLRRCIEGNVVQGTSRALSEEVGFDRSKVTSIDWLSYPILDITEAPDAVDIVLINRPELPPAGAGESSICPVAAALANAVFDATGVRLRPCTVDAGAAQAEVGVRGSYATEAFLRSAARDANAGFPDQNKKFPDSRI
jgi:CO/xanthine dehydrogenase Mo-binding subunit